MKGSRWQTSRARSPHSDLIRILNVGRNYRFEAVDATHEWMFHQIDGFAVDEGLTLADLKGTLTAFRSDPHSERWPQLPLRGGRRHPRVDVSPDRRLRSG